MNSPRGTRKQWSERPLGSGTFGNVTLFYSNFGDNIALKEMKVEALRNLEGHERDKAVMRLKNEIKIMWEHNHPNLIRALGPPQDIPYQPPDDVMHVWMEYCNGGDLRSVDSNGYSYLIGTSTGPCIPVVSKWCNEGVLRAPHNCCGVEEKDVRRICKDINSGIRFLHKISVIHRDLKPENILIKHTDNNTVTYKLTDFGYAKTYGLSSKAESLVGTPQYVAPEIIDSDTHGRPVDFWSFGVVTFELVTGIRPFLHKSKGLLDWVGPTCNKPDNCIYITQNRGSVKFNESIPSPHQISSVFAEELTKWLQIVLHQKPEKRGVAVKDEEAPCLIHIDRILSTKILNIVSMSKGHVLSYVVNDDSNYHSLSAWLEEKGYPKAQQYLVTDQGELLSNSLQNLSTILRWDDCVSTVYLFTDGQVPSFKLVENVTPSVKNLITCGDDNLHKEDKYTHYAHAYSHIKEQERLFWRLHDGHRAILQLIKPVCDELQGSHDDHRFELSKCLGMAEFMKKMYSDDMKNFTEPERREKWDKELKLLAQAIEELNSLTSEMDSLKKEIEQEKTKFEVMSQAVISSRDYFENFHSSCVTKALDIIRKEKTHEYHDSMADLVTRSSQFAETIIQDHLNRLDFLRLYLQLKSLINRRKSIKPKICSLEQRCHKINDTIREDMWSLIKIQRGSVSSANFDVTQSLDNSAFNGSGPIYMRSSSASSCSSILLRMRSYSSQSSESVDIGDEELQSLVGSLKSEIMTMRKKAKEHIDENEDIRRAQLAKKTQSSESRSISSSQ